MTAITPIAVLISGRGSNMAALLYASRQPDCPYKIVLVASDKADAAGLAFAKAEGVPVFAAPKEGRFGALDQACRDAGTEVIALAGFMRILPAAFVSGWEGRIVNIHPSLLPAYKGLDTHARALAAGDTHAGCSVHVVTPALDDGPVLAQTRVAILPGDTPDTLAARVLIAEHQLYPRALAAFVMRDRTPEALLGRVREIALALPGAEEALSHGMPSFRVGGGRMFCYFSENHHSVGVLSAIVKTSGPEEQTHLIEDEPDIYYKPAYFGVSGWIGVRLTAATDWDSLQARIEASWTMVAPKRFTAMREF